MARKKYFQALISPNVHRKLKTISAESWLPMSHIVILLIEEAYKAIVDGEESCIKADELIAKAKVYSPEQESESQPGSKTENSNLV